MKILIVEDNPIDLKLFSAILATQGSEVEGQSTTEGALEALRDRTPDVLLLDLHLGPVDGLTFVRGLRYVSGLSGVPVVAITAYPLWFPENDVLAAGCAACLIKPVDTRQFAQRIRAIVNSASTNASIASSR